MNSFYCVISFPIANWDKNTTDDAIVEFCKKQGYNRVGSGTGFGFRDLEFGAFSSKHEFRIFEASVRTQFPFVTSITIHDFD